MRVLLASFLGVSLFACPGPAESDGGTGGGGTTTGGGTATDAGITTDAGIDAGLWPVALAANEVVNVMAALDSGDLIVAVRDTLTNESAVIRLGQDGVPAWRYPLGTRWPGWIDVSLHDRIIVSLGYDYVVLNPDGTLRHEVPAMGRLVYVFDRNEVVWGPNFHLDDTGTISMSRLGVDTSWIAANVWLFDVEDYFVVLGNNVSPPYDPAIRAIDFDGGVRWSLPVGLTNASSTMDAYEPRIRLGTNGAAYVGHASSAGDGGTLTLDVGCGAAGPHTVSAIENGACLWTRSWNPGRVLGRGELLAFAPTPDGVAVWNGSSLDIYDARDGGTKATLCDGGVLNIAASRVVPTVYYFDTSRRLVRAR